LVPRLVESGFEVVNVSRGQRASYQPHVAWKAVRTIALDRAASEKQGTFATTIADLRPDIVIDMICFPLASAQQLVAALSGRVQHFLHTGPIWVHGPSVSVPTTEMQPRKPFGEYGIQKAAIEAFLLEQARLKDFPATIIHPGHIVGPGWPPLNPAGNFNPKVFETLARGERLALPHLGLETVHHVHADDVAQIFMRAIARWSVSVGEAFHNVSPAALSLRGYAENMAAWFGKQPNLEFLPWSEWKVGQSDEDAAQTWEHITHSPNSSIAKAQRLLDYQPRYSSLEAVQESVNWLIQQGQVMTADRR